MFELVLLITRPDSSGSAYYTWNISKFLYGMTRYWLLDDAALHGDLILKARVLKQLDTELPILRLTVSNSCVLHLPGTLSESSQMLPTCVVSTTLTVLVVIDSS